MKVWTWPKGVGQSRLYSPPHRVRITETWSGAPGQIAALPPRARCVISGAVAGRYDQARGRGADLDIILDRLEGGQSLVAVWDGTMRRQCGWADAVADTGDDELWRADGRVDLWAGESAGGIWRSVLVSGTGSLGSTSLSVTGLLTGETIPKGCWVRAGDIRYRVAETASESGGGATLTLARPLEVAVSGNVRLPGDLFVGRLAAVPSLGETAIDGQRSFSVDLLEVYEDEITDNTTSPPTGFEYQ